MNKAITFLLLETVNKALEKSCLKNIDLDDPLKTRDSCCCIHGIITVNVLEILKKQLESDLS